MKIMFFVPSTIIGGAETLLLYQVRWHRKLFPEDDIYVAVIGHTNGLYYQDIAHHAKLLLTPDSDSLALEIDYVRPEIFQTYHSMVAYKALARVRNRPPIVIEQVHGCFKFQNCSVDIPKIYTDHIVAVSEKAKNFFLYHLPECADRTSVILNGIDHEIFTEKGRMATTEKLRIGTLSRISEADKKITKIIDAFNMIANLNVEFFIIGSGYSENECRLYAKSKSANFQKKLRWIPYQPDPQNWYKKLDIFVSRCESEGFGNSIAEALLSGTSVVAHYCGGITDHLPADYYYQCFNQNEFEHQLIKAIEDPAGRAKMTKEALAYAKQNFTAERMAREYRKLYLALLNEPRVPRVVKAPIIGIAPAGFTGVCESLSKHTDIMIRVPNDRNIISYVQEIAKYAPRAILVGGSFTDLDSFIFHLNTKWKTPVYYTVHNSFSFCEFNPTIDGGFMKKQVDLVKTGKVKALLCTKKGMAEVLQKNGIAAHYLPNKVTKPDYAFNKEEQMEGINIGILGTGLPWKNQLIQILAASTIEGATIHVNSVGPHKELLNRIGCKYKEHGHLDHYKLTNLIRQMTLVSAVSYTETFCYVVMEAAALGIPAVISPMVPAYDDSDVLSQECVVHRIDCTSAIAERMRNIMGKRSMLSKEVQRLFEQYAKNNDNNVLEAILNGKC